MPPSLPPTDPARSPAQVAPDAPAAGPETSLEGSPQARAALGRELNRDRAEPMRQVLRRRLLPAPFRGHGLDHAAHDAFVPQRMLPAWVRTQEAPSRWLAEESLASFPPMSHAQPARTTLVAPQPVAPAALSYRDAVLGPPGGQRNLGPPAEVQLALSVPGLPQVAVALPEPLSDGALVLLEEYLTQGGDAVQLHLDMDRLLGLLLSTEALLPRPRATVPDYPSCAPTQLTRRQQAEDVCCVTKEPFAEIERPVAVRTGEAVHLFGYARLAEWWQNHQTNPATTLPLSADGWLRVLPEPSDAEGPAGAR